MKSKARLRSLLLAALVATPVAAVAAAPLPQGGFGTLHGGTVAVYDAETVLLATRAFAPERARLDRLVDAREQEIAALRLQVHGLRDRLNAEGARLPLAERRRVEARLAERTIVLIAARTAAAREIGDARDALLAHLGGEIVPAVAAVAGEQGIAVVVRQDEATRVLGGDVVDLTARIVARLDAGADPEPDLGRRARARLQSCAPPPDDAP